MSSQEAALRPAHHLVLVLTLLLKYYQIEMILAIIYFKIFDNND